MNHPAEFWNNRYNAEDYVYGEDANQYLVHQLQSLQPGKILFPADGEGRNSVFAATQGWETDSFDISEVGRKKALQLATSKNTDINYKISSVEDVNYDLESFDAIALIYAHFHDSVRKEFHKKLTHFLKPGGVIILEAFSKNHPPFQAKYPKIGGPRDMDMLYSVDDIREDFEGFDIVELSDIEVNLNEGDNHVGTGKVIRFYGIKK